MTDDAKNRIESSYVKPHESTKRLNVAKVEGPFWIRLRKSSGFLTQASIKNSGLTPEILIST